MPGNAYPDYSAGARVTEIALSPAWAKLRGPDINRTIDPGKFLALNPQLDARANARLRLFYVSMGMLDGLITSHGVLKRVLAEQGVEYTLVETPGYAHEWRYWRLCLADLARRLFRPIAD